MMLAIGCIQALTCNTNTCPTGVRSLAEIYPAVQEGALLRGEAILPYQEMGKLAHADAFTPRDPAPRFASIAPPAPA